MPNSLENFVERIDTFDKLSYASQIQYFAYFLQIECNKDYFNAKDITDCFTQLSLKPYSNIPALLSKKSKGKDYEYLFHSTKGNYIISRNLKKSIEERLNVISFIPPTNELIDLSILNKTPYYIQKNAIQMAKCYDVCLYDAVLVLMRKLFETLIIETFERYGCDDSIKDSNGVFFYLSDLIPAYLNSDKWNSSRNIGASLKVIKKYGDLSAHNRRFLAQKSDIEKIKSDMRQAIQEIVLTIDYPNWNKHS